MSVPSLCRRMIRNLIKVPAGGVAIGTRLSDIDSVLADLRMPGVQREWILKEALPGSSASSQPRGFHRAWCVEVNTPEFGALPVEEAARQAADAAAAALEAAGVQRA